MAHASGYEYDIFISYSRNDNVEIGSSKGWVTGFNEDLYNSLVKLRGLKNLTIWHDDRGLDGNTDFDQAIENRLRKTALLFVLHSRNYLDSQYCRKELEWFYRQNEHRPGGLRP